MSALTSHIRVLRAQGDGYAKIAAIELNETGQAVLSALAKANHAAADVLEEAEAALKPPREGEDCPITYDPKGKR